MFKPALSPSHAARRPGAGLRPRLALLVLLALSLVLGACSGRSRVLSEPDPELIELKTETNRSVEGTFRVANLSGKPVGYTLVSSESWLQPRAPRGSLEPQDSATLTLVAACPALPVVQSGVVTLGNTLTDETYALTVQLSCVGQPALGAVSPVALELFAPLEGSAAANLSFTNTGEADLVYAVGTEGDWLSVDSPPRGTLEPGIQGGVALSAHCGPESGILEGFVELTSNDPQSSVVSVPVRLVCSDAVRPGFGIDLRFGAGVDAELQAVFEAAAARWATIMVEDLPAAMLVKAEGQCGVAEAIDEVVDDLLIHVEVTPSGMSSDAVAAGPCVIREGVDGRFLPVFGTMSLSSAGVSDFAARGTLDEVVLHGMGHVLGIGTHWDRASVFGTSYLSYATDPPERADYSCRNAASFTTKPTYTGSNGLAAFVTLGGSDQPLVEDEGGPGVQCSHWDKGFFGDELMAGAVGAAGDLRLSLLSVAALADLGYSVELGAADGYRLPSCRPNCDDLEDASEDEGLAERVLAPRFTLGEGGALEQLRPKPVR